MENKYLKLLSMIGGCWSLFFVAWQLISKPYLEPIPIIRDIEIVMSGLLFLSLSYYTIKYLKELI